MIMKFEINASTIAEIDDRYQEIRLDFRDDMTDVVFGSRERFSKELPCDLLSRMVDKMFYEMKLKVKKRLLNGKGKDGGG